MAMSFEVIIAGLVLFICCAVYILSFSWAKSKTLEEAPAADDNCWFSPTYNFKNLKQFSTGSLQDRLENFKAKKQLLESTDNARDEGEIEKLNSLIIHITADLCRRNFIATTVTVYKKAPAAQLFTRVDLVNLSEYTSDSLNNTLKGLREEKTLLDQRSDSEDEDRVKFVNRAILRIEEHLRDRGTLQDAQAPVSSEQLLAAAASELDGLASELTDVALKFKEQGERISRLEEHYKSLGLL